MTTAWRWLRRQAIDVVLIGIFLLGFVSLIHGGRVAGMLVASAAIAVWLGAVVVAQMKVVHSASDPRCSSEEPAPAGGQVPALPHLGSLAVWTASQDERAARERA